MQKQLPSLFAGIALIIAGGLALLDNVAFGHGLPPALWVAVFAGLSVLSLVAYGLSGVKHWGWLFPAGVFGGLAGTLALALTGTHDGAVAAPLFAGLAVPFAAAYVVDRARRWWALIPAGVMAALALLMLGVDHLNGEWVGSGFLFLMAGAFLVVFLSQPAQKWAALLAYILAVLGCMPLLAAAGQGMLAGVVMLAAIGLPFLNIYLSSPARWWAIIPAGLLLWTAGLAALALVFGSKLDQTLGNALMLLGGSATLAVVWVRHQKRWAGLAAAGLAIVGVGTLFFRAAANLYWPVLLVAAGAYLLYQALRRRTA